MDRTLRYARTRDEVQIESGLHFGEANATSGCHVNEGRGKAGCQRVEYELGRVGPGVGTQQDGGFTGVENEGHHP